MSVVMVKGEDKYRMRSTARHHIFSVIVLLESATACSMLCFDDNLYIKLSHNFFSIQLLNCNVWLQNAAKSEE